MPPESEFIPGLFVRDDDEGLFSRDINGQLVHLDAATESSRQMRRNEMLMQELFQQRSCWCGWTMPSNRSKPIQERKEERR